jgi:D-serine deaminase-like pyridoxal phosphate-dependent protein
MATSGYRDAVGGARADIVSPALLLDLDKLSQNIEAMASWALGTVAIRPHAKIHKCVEIARLQLESGAQGLTVATIWELLALCQAEPPSILLANELLDPRKLDLLAGAARERDCIIAVDSVEGADALSAAACRAGVEIGALVDVDVGMGRCGVRSVGEALEVAAVLDRRPGVAVRGVMGYEGHVVTEPDRAKRAQGAAEAMDLLAGYVDVLEQRGFAIDIVSAGGTNTFDMTGIHPRVTELQTGSYAVMDAMYAPLTPTFKPALTVLARCISRHGSTAVLDCGTKAVTVDYTLPVLPTGAGSIREVHEEHMLLDVPSAGGPQPGDPIELVVGYCGGTCNLHDAYYVVRGDEVVDVWRIHARGAGRGVP